jgi:sirohydrochlorin cobaltochelatase
MVTTVGLSAQEQDHYREKDLLGSLKPGDKAALLMVHFGTTYDETRAKTIDAINAKAAEAFPELTLRDAYTSRIVIRRLKARGIEKTTPLEALLRLRADGFTHVIVQSTTLLDGAEMESLRRDVASVEGFFKEIRVGTPLLYDVTDSQKVADILATRHSAAADAKLKAHVVLVGHGTYTPATSTYSQIDYMFSAQGYPFFHVATLEGYPTFDTMLARLKAAKARRVTLVPLLFVAGDHASNDIAVDWREALEKEGLQVDCRLEGMGEIPEIQDIYIEHIRFSLHHAPVDIMKKKQEYAAGKE